MKMVEERIKLQSFKNLGKYSQKTYWFVVFH